MYLKTTDVFINFLSSNRNFGNVIRFNFFLISWRRKMKDKLNVKSYFLFFQSTLNCVQLLVLLFRGLKRICLVEIIIFYVHLYQIVFNNMNALF